MRDSEQIVEAIQKNKVTGRNVIPFDSEAQQVSINYDS
jgi:hypothetical protein